MSKRALTVPRCCEKDMTELLRKIFIKDRNNTENPNVRAAHGKLSSSVSMVCNILLAIMKTAAGALFGSVSISADGLNNLSDAMSGAMLFAGFKLSNKKADKGHPLGHGRIEYLSGLGVSFVIMLMGFELLRSSFFGIFNEDSPEFSPLVFGVLAFSLCAKLWLWAFNRRIAKIIDSRALLAGACDSLFDCISTFAVLCGAAFNYFFDIDLDGYIGCGVALLIIFGGARFAKDTLSSLLGRAPDPELAANIEDILLSSRMVSGIHDLIVHEYGPTRLYASVHVELPGDMSILEAHECIDALEMRIKEKLRVDITVHPDPVCARDPEYERISKLVSKVIRGINKEYMYHDLHITRVSDDAPLNVSFDAVIPPDDLKHSNDIAREIKERLSAEDPHLVLSVRIETKYM